MPVSSYTEDEYGAYVYGKGPLFFDEVRKFIGDDAFFAALQEYYQTFKYQIATPDDLIQLFNKASGKDIRPLYQKWIVEG